MRCLLRVEAEDFVGVARAAHDDGAAVMDVLGDDVQNAAHLAHNHFTVEKRVVKQQSENACKQ